MSVEQRIRTCRLLEKMKNQETFCKRLGLEDASVMNGKHLYQKDKVCIRRDRGTC